MMSAMNLVLSDRQQRITNRIRLTGVSPSLLVFGKLIGAMLATTVQLSLLYILQGLFYELIGALMSGCLLV